MFTANFKSRVQEILDFITEITLGNYTYTLPLRNQKDELEQIVLSLNTMVEEIDTAVHQINLEKSKEVLENIVFTLDSNYHITSYSKNVREILGYQEEQLLNRSVKRIIKDTKLPEDLLKFNSHNIEKGSSFKIDLRHRKEYLWSGIAYLQEMITEKEKTYTLSVFKAVYYNERLRTHFTSKQSRTKSYPTEYRSLLLQDQREVVRELHQYVMERLDTNLPKIRVIGRDVGCSVSKIKKIYKRTYGVTIYAYHRRKRLEKAYVLMKNSNTPINVIAGECGFKSASHFTRTFKKAYGINPLNARNS